jgi:hypothetical protein
MNSAIRTDYTFVNEVDQWGIIRAAVGISLPFDLYVLDRLVEEGR